MPRCAAMEMAVVPLEVHAMPPRKQAPTPLEVHSTKSSSTESDSKAPRSGQGSSLLSSLCVPSLLVARGEGEGGGGLTGPLYVKEGSGSC